MSEITRDVSSSSYAVRGATLDDALALLSTYTAPELRAVIVNDTLNRFVAAWADGAEGDSGKFVPYVGWFWRSTDFVTGKIPIGNCGEFIGVMESNKWDYPERNLTEDEATKVVGIVWEAYRLSRAGGNLAEIRKNTSEKLAELWPLFQTFEIEDHR